METPSRLPTDVEKLSSLFMAKRKQIVNFFAYHVKDRDLAEDLTQDVCEKMLRAVASGQYQEEGTFSAWIMTIAHNVFIDKTRRDKKRRSVRDHLGLDPASRLPDNKLLAEDILVNQGIEIKVKKLIRHLPYDQRTIVSRRIYSKRKFKDIAAEDGISINTALGRMRYALINLRKLIKEHQIDLSGYKPG